MSNKTSFNMAQKILEKHLLPYFFKCAFSCGAVECALEDFFDGCYDGSIFREQFENDVFFHGFFVNWMFFHWSPCDHFDAVSGFDDFEMIAKNYLMSHEESLKPEARRFVQKMNQSFYSFYYVQAVSPDRAVKVQDLLLNETHTIEDPKLAKCLKLGDIVFANAVIFEYQLIFTGIMPLPISLRVLKKNVDELIDCLMEDYHTIDEECLCDEEMYVFECFFYILHDMAKSSVIDRFRLQTKGADKIRKLWAERFCGVACFEQMKAKMLDQKLWGAISQQASSPLFDRAGVFSVEPKKEP